MKRFRIQYSLLALLLLFVFGEELNAAVKLPRLVSSGMVLQRNEPVTIWGWADAGEKIKIEFLGEVYKIKADRNGDWQLELNAMAAGGPYSMTINDIVLNDILIGDVWLASGQSNMELKLNRVMDLYADEIQKINTDQIRLFRSSTRENAEEERADYPDGKWLSSTPENIMEFSAVAWLFADKIHESQDVPVGIISTAIGGSPAEAWLSKNKVTPFLDEWLEQGKRIDSMRAAYVEKNGEIKPYNWGQKLTKTIRVQENGRKTMLMFQVGHRFLFRGTGQIKELTFGTVPSGFTRNLNWMSHWQEKKPFCAWDVLSTATRLL